jgi:hypothetical protein
MREVVATFGALASRKCLFAHVGWSQLMRSPTVVGPIGIGVFIAPSVPYSSADLSRTPKIFFPVPALLREITKSVGSPGEAQAFLTFRKGQGWKVDQGDFSRFSEAPASDFSA